MKNTVAHKLIVLAGLFFISLTLLIACGKNDKGICESKGDNWYWDGSDNSCQEKEEGAETAPPSSEGVSGLPNTNTEEACKAKTGGDYVWDASLSECKQLDFFMLIYPKDSDLFKVHVALENKKEQYIDKQSENKCIKVYESHLPKLKVRVKASYFSWGYDDVCEGTATAGAGEKCLLGVYEIDSEGQLNKVADEKRTDCITLEPTAN